MSTSPLPIHVIGGGLAGSEAAWQIASAGVPVVLHEMRPVRQTEAHQTDGLAEMVCSNSFRSDDAEYNAVGLLHEEMRRCDSLILRCADAHKVPAGGALAVDRDAFSAAVSDTLARHPLVTSVREEVAGLPPEDWDSVIVATGPLTSPALAEAVRGPDRRGKPLLLRRHRADRPQGEHRPVQGVVPVALRQAGSGRHGQGLHQLRDGQGPVHRLHPGPDRRAERPTSRSGRRTLPTSKAACRSRSWRRAASTRCGTGR